MYSLAKFKQAQIAYGVLYFSVGLLFFLCEVVGLSSMDPGAYGEIATTARGETWAMMQMGSSFLLLMGLLINGRWRWSAVVRMTASALLGATFAALAVSALYAPQGAAIFAACTVFWASCIWIFWLALIDLIGAVRRGG